MKMKLKILNAIIISLSIIINMSSDLHAAKHGFNFPFMLIFDVGRNLTNSSEIF